MDNFACVRIEKIKTVDGVKKCEAEHNRTGEFANRDNIDQDKTPYNVSMRNWRGDNLQSLEDVFQQQKSVYNQNHKRALRKDAVHMLDGVLVLSKVDKGQAQHFANACKQFLQTEFPNCYWTIWAHRDEKAIHCHFAVCAIDKDGNCITDKTMNKENLRKMQTSFAKICQKNGLEDVKRGISKEDRYEQNLPQNYHKNPWQYARECTRQAQKAIEAEKLAKNRQIFAEKEAQKAMQAEAEAKARTRQAIEDAQKEIDFREYLISENRELAKQNAEIISQIAKNTLLAGKDDIDFVTDCISWNNGIEDR